MNQQTSLLSADWSAWNYQQDEFDLGQYVAENYGSPAKILDTVLHGGEGGAKKHMAQLRELAAIAKQLHSVEFSLSAEELQSLCLKQLETIESRYSPNPGVIVGDDFKRIVFPDGKIVNLANTPRRRAVVRFIYEHVRRTGEPKFEIDFIRREHDKAHPTRPWNCDRFREDLFKRHYDDFDLLFETVDAANGIYLLKI